MSSDDCPLCEERRGDAELGREEVWSDELWRLTTSVGPGDCTPGFSYLEPKRHVPHVEDLEGREAESFGRVLARCARALKDATAAERVYVYIFGGGIPHLHVHLAPHRTGDALNDALLRGEFEAKALPSGATAYVSKDFPAIPEEESRAAADRVRAILTAGMQSVDG